MMTPREFLKSTADHFTSQEAAHILGLTSIDTAKVLHKWMKQGWICRTSRGIYAGVPLLASESSSLDSPFSVVPSLMGEGGYICGWSALSHWGLTEQIFRDVSLASYQAVRLKKKVLESGVFFLFPSPHIPPKALKPLWFGDKRVWISDIHQTILDSLARPAWGGGILHVVDCFKNYMINENCSWDSLLSHAEEASVKGVFFKRLGFLLEQLGGPVSILEMCQKHLTKGYTAFDPHVHQGLFCRRWNLIIPEHLKL